MAFEKWIDKAKGSFSEKLAELKETFLDEEKQKLIQEFKEKGHEKIDQILKDLDSSQGIMHSAGYALNAFQVELGMPPAITLTFELLPHSEAIDQEAIIQAADNALIKLILKALLRARKVTHAFEWGSFTCSEVKICLGMIPDIHLEFRKANQISSSQGTDCAV